MLRFASFLLRFYGKDCKTGLTKIVAHLTNSNLCKKRFSKRLIRFPGSNLDSGEITGNVIGSARSKDLTAWARGLSPTNTTRSDAPHRWRARRPLASRVRRRLILKSNYSVLSTLIYLSIFGDLSLLLRCFIRLTLLYRLRDSEKVFFTPITAETMKKTKNPHFSASRRTCHCSSKGTATYRNHCKHTLCHIEGVSPIVINDRTVVFLHTQ